MNTIERTHHYEVGDILYSSWGYGQTNIDFYKVKEIRGKSTLVLVELEKDVLEQTGFEVYKVVPKNVEKKGTLKVRAKGGIQQEHPLVKVGYSQYAGLWNGKPITETKYH